MVHPPWRSNSGSIAPYHLSISEILSYSLYLVGARNNIPQQPALIEIDDCGASRCEISLMGEPPELGNDRNSRTLCELTVRLHLLSRCMVGGSMMP